MSIELLAKKAAWFQLLHPYGKSQWGLSVRVKEPRNEIAHLFAGDSLDDCIAKALQHCKPHKPVPLYGPGQEPRSTGTTGPNPGKPKLKLKTPDTKKKLKLKVKQ